MTAMAGPSRAPVERPVHLANPVPDSPSASAGSAGTTLILAPPTPTAIVAPVIAGAPSIKFERLAARTMVLLEPKEDRGHKGKGTFGEPLKSKPAARPEPEDAFSAATSGLGKYAEWRAKASNERKAAPAYWPTARDWETATFNNTLRQLAEAEKRGGPMYALPA